MTHMDGSFVQELSDRLEAPLEIGQGGYIATPEGWTLHDPASLVKPGPQASALTVSTLSALTDYLKANRDALKLETLVVHIVAPHAVSVVGALSERARVRETFVTAACTDSTVGFVGKFMPLDEFIIGLQARFLDRDDRARVLAVIGNVTQEAIKTSVDDGVTQVVSTRAGIVRQSESAIPNPVKLVPFRTFREVDQPRSPFVLRVNGDRGDGRPTQAALFEADAGTWKLTAIDRVQAWLSEALAGVDVKILA